MEGAAVGAALAQPVVLESTLLLSTGSYEDTTSALLDELGNPYIDPRG
jgi:hypothetical protein